jgi:hypothetical protein
MVGYRFGFICGRMYLALGFVGYDSKIGATDVPLHAASFTLGHRTTSVDQRGLGYTGVLSIAMHTMS